MNEVLHGGQERLCGVLAGGVGAEAALEPVSFGDVHGASVARRQVQANVPLAMRDAGMEARSSLVTAPVSVTRGLAIA